MRVEIIGAGPAGLYAAWSIRSRNDRADVTVWECHPPRDTEGFGVIFSRSALASLSLRDQAFADGVTAGGESFASIQLLMDGAHERIPSPGFVGVERAPVLGMLHQRCRDAGVTLRYGTPAPPLAELSRAADVVIVAEGVGSQVRSALATRFGTRIVEDGMYYTWLGTSRTFDGLTFTVLRHRTGLIVTHAYPYAPSRSTFIVEVIGSDPSAAGVCTAADPDSPSISALERLLAGTLGEQPLFARRSQWRRFRMVTNDTWWADNIVLVGDAAHTTHFSIGSGTKLALEDAAALAEALTEEAGVPAAFSRYEADRRPVVEKAQDVAERSRLWFAGIGDLTGSPREALRSLATRGGSIDLHDLELADGDSLMRSRR
jgi:2-polyprenyl-6-methoxyphenol hydroxylase-like FAD-dependent oxidoreductase